MGNYVLIVSLHDDKGFPVIASVSELGEMLNHLDIEAMLNSVPLDSDTPAIVISLSNESGIVGLWERVLGDSQNQ